MALPLEPIASSGGGDDRMNIACLYCNQVQAISRKAQSITCKFCNKSLKLQDVPIDKFDTRTSIETLGIVTIGKKGMVSSKRVLCGGLVVRGKLKAAITSLGPMLVGPEAEVIGDVTAPTLAVGAGAILEGKYQIGQKQ